MSLLSDFIDVAPEGTLMTLGALACAESLTDRVALNIYKLVPIPGLSAEDFISAFKYSGLTEPRNSEWNLIPSLRNELVATHSASSRQHAVVHRYLLSISSEENRKLAGFEVPAYLFTDGGRAYHLAGTGSVDDALKNYSRASLGPFNGAQWLGAKLAEEQERTGVIPADQVETMFLRAWVLWREGKKREAKLIFMKVAATDQVKREVAIALHIIGNDNGRGQRKEAEAQLRRSIEIDGRLGNDFGTAKTLHSLGNLLTRRNRLDDAEAAYRESIAIDGRHGNDFGVAQTLHSLGNLLTRQDRLDDAEAAYRESIAIGQAIDQPFHGAQVLHSLGNLLTRRNRLDDAEAAYRESIDSLRRLGNDFGVAQVLHSLGNLLTRQDRLDDAEVAYRESIRIGETLRNDNHLAQVLRSYALSVESISPERTIELLQRSLDINRRNGNERFVRLVERTIREVRDRHKNRR